METAVLSPSRVVVPGTIRLPLSRGDYLIVKQRLNAGETLDLFARVELLAGAGLDDTVSEVTRRLLKVQKLPLVFVTTYLIDWILTDLDGAVIPVRGQSADAIDAALRLLDYDSLVEVQNACMAHDAATRQEKKLRDNASGS